MFSRFCTHVLVAAMFTTAMLLLAFYQTLSDVLQDIGLSPLTPTASSNGPSPASHEESGGGMPELVHESKNTSTPDAILVLATLASTDISWVQDELGDLLDDHLGTAFYVNDDTSAPLHTPANKGHEAMAYLTYMIDRYDSLPEISIFMHSHPDAWHNNYLLGMSSSQIVRYLNRKKVARDGYMNLRCHWNPGCPTHLNPLATEIDPDKQEEVEIKDAWTAMFPLDNLPESLAQPCCSQFAVTRERIHNLPRERYVHFRNWILKSDLSDYLTGRVFEYFWQYMLNSSTTYCPDPRICYCDGYGICFEDSEDYEKYFELATEWQKLGKQLTAWKEWKHISERSQESVQGTGGFVQIDPKFPRVKQLADSEAGKGLNPNGDWDRGDWLTYHIDKLSKQMSESKDQALAAGKDPARRAAALNAARKNPIKTPKGALPWWL